MMTSCGGGSSNKGAAQSGDSEKTTETKTEAATSVKKVEGSNKWPDNHFTKQVPRLEFAINSDGVDVDENRVIVRFRDAKPTKEQVKAYWGKIKAAGFTVNVLEADDNFGLSYQAKNATGYTVELTDYSITIRKP
jgi:hypothetical protein